jgi:hypothetical protein
MPIAADFVQDSKMATGMTGDAGKSDSDEQNRSPAHCDESGLIVDFCTCRRVADTLDAGVAA